MSSEIVIRWLESWSQFNAGAAAALAAMFILTALVPIPRTVVVLGAGAAFGGESLWVAVPSTTLGCVVAFLLARGLLRDWVQQQAARRPTWQVVARAIDEEGWHIVALLRFWGPLPCMAQNYLFGLTRIGLLPYSLVTAIFTLPQIIFYTYLGASGRAVLIEGGGTPLSWVPLGLAALVMAATLFLVSRRVRQILARTRPAVVVVASETAGTAPRASFDRT